MAYLYWSRPLKALLGLLSLASAVSAASIDMTYCASLLTTSSSANSSNFQSDGLCYNFCNGDYAFAIVQEKNCWCSDYAPDTGDRVDTSECNIDCPGYPDDTCGGSGLYGYMQLGKAAAGTSGGSKSTTAAATSTTQDSTGTTVGKATSTTPSTTASPSTYVSTITQGGSVQLQTVTVMPTAAYTSDSSTANVSSGQKGLSTGAAVGIAVGVLGFVVLGIAVGFFFWLRRKRRNQLPEGSMLEHQNSFRGSSAGMMGTPRTEMASVWESEAQSVGRRSSRLMPHDPRMDPYAANIYGRFDNKSRESINTLRDDQDYSRRVLRTTNPDPTAGE
ncbi:hypothetical protein TruAng_007083 [Truncatella angustata]|nr:hypothetical protein TruAng_007083 [Truncatella angustata]